MVVILIFFYKLTMVEFYKFYMECEIVMIGRIWNVNVLCWVFIFF